MQAVLSHPTPTPQLGSCEEVLCLDRFGGGAMRQDYQNKGLTAKIVQPKGLGGKIGLKSSLFAFENK